MSYYIILTPRNPTDTLMTLCSLFMNLNMVIMHLLTRINYYSTPRIGTVWDGLTNWALNMKCLMSYKNSLITILRCICLQFSWFKLFNWFFEWEEKSHETFISSCKQLKALEPEMELMVSKWNSEVFLKRSRKYCSRKSNLQK